MTGSHSRDTTSKEHNHGNLFCARRGKRQHQHSEKQEALAQALKVIGKTLRKVLVLPPDHTRLNSNAGELTHLLYQMLSPNAEVDIMPALGTHSPMTEKQLRMMFGDVIPLERFKVHDWRNGIRHVGDVPGSLIREWSGGIVDYDVRVEVSQRLFAGYDLILSVGQLVPHEVVGIANYTKNLLTGAGGADTINKSHFLGAAYGMERMMGRIDTPVRRLFNYGAGDVPARSAHRLRAHRHGKGQGRQRDDHARACTSATMSRRSLSARACRRK